MAKPLMVRGSGRGRGHHEKASWKLCSWADTRKPRRTGPACSMTVDKAHLLLMAESSTQGMLVAPRTRVPSLLFPTPVREGQGERRWQDREQHLCPWLPRKASGRPSLNLSREVVMGISGVPHTQGKDEAQGSPRGPGWRLPCIWTKNSVLILRAASLSFSLREPQRESTSSMKMMEGLCCRASSNRFLTSL